jgi:hypothetical protein
MLLSLVFLVQRSEKVGSALVYDKHQSLFTDEYVVVD